MRGRIKQTFSLHAQNHAEGMHHPKEAAPYWSTLTNRIYTYTYIRTKSYPKIFFSSPVPLSSTMKLFCPIRTSNRYDKMTQKYTELHICSLCLRSHMVHAKDLQIRGAGSLAMSVWIEAACTCITLGDMKQYKCGVCTCTLMGISFW